MKQLNKQNGMYALLVAVAAMIGVTIYGSCSADEDFWGFDDEYTSTENTRSEVKDMSGYLKLSTYDPFKWTYEDNVIVQKALNRMTLKHEGTKVIVKDKNGSDLNMSEELYNLIKDGFGDGYEVMQENHSGQSNKKKNISRRKTRDPENFNYHNCTRKDYVGHAIALNVSQNIDSVNNRIQREVWSSYPNEELPCASITQALYLFKNYVRQNTYFSSGATPPYPIPGIILTPGQALNGDCVYLSGGNYYLFGYNAEKKQWWYHTVTNECANSPCEVTESKYAYYK